ncbi:MAG: hypothetical protein ABIZ49_13875 [Opitutaceae bacterium]
MTPHEKAVNAINARLERLQANLREAKTETAKQFLFQSIVVTVGVAEALSGYIKAVGQHAQRRHGEIKQTNEALGAQHADLLNSGRELLEKLKANPADPVLRKEIEALQRQMAAIQKNLRRGANSLQRDVAPSTGMIDKLAVSIRRLCEADQLEELKRATKLLVGHVRELYLAQPTVESKDIIDPVSWEKSAGSQIDQATDFYDAYARAAYQTILALDAMTMAVSETPPRTAEEAINRSNESGAARAKAIAARFTTN